ncbi:nephrin-like [Sipha flava]|uniref:Nephrin n=1 Tax=Sipha flava TaxID=143950 RepID=A0A2S2QDI2_9HEMI|nr:nephrin-like [Sipha flava]
MVRPAVLALALLFWLNARPGGVSGQGPIRQIFAVVHGTASLPCDIAPPIPHEPLDTVILVVWYRYEKTAIYSVDIRDKFTDPNKSHWKDHMLEGRSHFRMLSEPAMLTIDNVSENDAGIYRCRVDFKNSPTRNSRLNLTVIVPPQKPVILSEYNEEIDHTGPFYEGDRVKMTCMVSGGRPEPKIRWWRGETLMDTGNEGISDQLYSYSSVKKNQLTIEALGRYDQGAVFTCQASNSNLSAPVSASVTIEMFLKPLVVQVLSSRQPLSAGRTYEIQCQAMGSKPPANITWWKDNERLTNATQTVSPDGNVTSSKLTFKPTKSDNGKSLICRAENDQVRQQLDNSAGKVEDTWKIDVHYVPLLKLALGINMNPADIEEGDDVYFECKIDANPLSYKVIWKHNGQVVLGSTKSGVIINQNDLALQNVKRQQAGNYSCLASNVEGDGESNVVRLMVMYKPVCKQNQKLTYGVARNENTEIVCEVDAYPAPEVFKWTFNRTGGPASENGNNEVVQHTGNGGSGEGGRAGGSSSAGLGTLSSVLNYSPTAVGMGGVADNDYGTVTCRASNTAGQQMEPCVFHVIAAVRPDPPFNCTSGDRTLSSVRVWCAQGFDGGVTQRFALEAYDSAGHVGPDADGPDNSVDGGPAVAADGPAPQLLANMTADRPDFTIQRLPRTAGLRLAVYAYNSRGTSDRTWLTAYTLNSADKQTTSGSSVVGNGANNRLHVTPVVAGLLAVTAVSAVVAGVVMCALRVRSRRHTDQRRVDVHGGMGTGSIMGGGAGGGAAVIAVCKQKADGDDYAAAALDPDKNPDLIPPTKVKGGSRGNIGYRVVQQLPMGLNDDDNDENLEAAESSDDERAGYPTLPVDGISSRPSVNSLRHAAASVGPGYSNNGYRPEQYMTKTTTISSRLPPYHHREIVTVRTPLMSSQQESCV